VKTIGLAVRAFPSQTAGKLIPGAGDGTFTVPVSSAIAPAGGNVFGRMASGDIDNDGLQELAVVANNGAIIVVYRQDSNGVWFFSDTVASPSSGTVPISTLALVDTRGQGVLDLVTVTAGNGGAFVALNGGGGGSFGSWSLINNSPLSPMHMVSADINGDPFADLVILAADGYIYFLMNSAGGGFLSSLPWSSVPFYCSSAAARDLPRPAAVADFDRCVAR
jgi:hypothetical protein